MSRVEQQDPSWFCVPVDAGEQRSGSVTVMDGILVVLAPCLMNAELVVPRIPLEVVFAYDPKRVWFAKRCRRMSTPSGCDGSRYRQRRTRVGIVRPLR